MMAWKGGVEMKSELDAKPTQVLQGADEIIVSASKEAIWGILTDSTRLPEWMPMVQRTDGHRESVGAVRHCAVNFEGRAGEVTERCVEADRDRIAWALEEDTLGFGKMLRDFGFAFVLSPGAEGETLVRNETYFEPDGLMATLMAALVLRRKFRQVRQAALQNLKQFVESTARGEEGDVFVSRRRLVSV